MPASSSESSDPGAPASSTDEVHNAPRNTDPPSSIWARRFVPLLLGVAILHGLIAWWAVGTKSPTIDEPLHLTGAFLAGLEADFRANPEDPPLFHRAMSLALIGMQTPSELIEVAWQDRISDRVEGGDRRHHAIGKVFYDAYPQLFFEAINRVRLVMIVVSIGMVFSVGWIVRHLLRRGVIATPERWAIGAAVLLAVEPTLLAHGPLLKNDVGLALVWLWATFALLRVVERFSWTRVLLLACLCTVGVMVKFSGVLLAPVVVIVLLLGAMMPQRSSDAPAGVIRRLTRAAGAIAICAAIGVLGIWTAYGFRYEASPGVAMDFEQLRIDHIQLKQMLEQVRSPHASTDTAPASIENATLSAAPAGGAVHGMVDVARRYRLLPEAFLYGMSFVHVQSEARPTFLLGHYDITGWRGYFPTAVAIKLPIGVLALLGGAAVIGVWSIIRRRGPGVIGWILFVSIGVYMVVSIEAKLNLGIRHLLPMWGPVGVAIVLIVARATLIAGERLSRAAGAAFWVLVIVAGLESLGRAPNFLAFRNAMFGDDARAYEVVVDSNLDWGQDLPAVAQWQRENPRTVMFMAYFGTVDPSLYGIDYLNVAPGYFRNAGRYMLPPTRQPDEPPMVLVISATHRQAVYVRRLKEQLDALGIDRPRAVLGGGSILIYDWPPSRRIGEARSN